MNWEIIITFLVGGGLGGAVAAYVALRTLKPNIRILTAQEKKVTADAADVAANALVDFVTAFQTERAEFTKRIDAQEKRIEVQEKKIDAQEAEIEAIKEARRAREIETQSERDELKVRIQSDLMETRELRANHDELKKKVRELNANQEKYLIEAAELKAAVEALRVQNKAAKNVIQKLVQALEEKQIPIPPLNGDLDKLGESVRGLVWPKGKPE